MLKSTSVFELCSTCAKGEDQNITKGRRPKNLEAKIFVIVMLFLLSSVNTYSIRITYYVMQCSMAKKIISDHSNRFTSLKRFHKTQQSQHGLCERQT